MKDNLVVIPGLLYKWGSQDFRKMINFFKDDYKVYFFEANYNQTNRELLKRLKKFLEVNKIDKSYFITHSYGIIILRLLLKEKTITDQRVVEIAPFNKSSKTLEKVHNLAPFIFSKIVLAAKEFLENKETFLNLPEPEFFGVIAGSQSFRWASPEYYLIRLLVNPTMKNSDGKVFIDETKTKKMKDFKVVHKNHTDIFEDNNVFGMIKNFFEKGKFD